MACYRHQCCKKHKEMVMYLNGNQKLTFDEWKKWYLNGCDKCQNRPEACIRRGAQLMTRTIH